MSGPAPSPLQVLVLAPTGSDAEVLVAMLSREGLSACSCADLPEFCERMDEGAGAAILADEALGEEQQARLRQSLTRQPEWSDFPLIIMTTPRHELGSGWRMLRDETLPTHAVILERPVHTDTLLSAVRAALRSRQRQYQIRDELAHRRQAEEALREADRRKDEFLAVLSHELRNPLSPIKNSLYILERAAPGGEQARRALTIASRQAGQLVRLVDDLLDVTRITRNKISLQYERLDLNELVRGTLEDHRNEFTAARVHLGFNPAPQAVFARADRNRMTQVVGNLLQNAVKFTPPEGRVEVEVLREGDHARIQVSDSGVGMDPDTLDRLFQPFMQAESSLDRSKGGLGLGLALVRGLVELHGGAVTASSEGLGKGSRFEVSLPVLLGENAAIEPEPSADESLSRRVLIIEDNIDAADSLRELLQINGQEVEVAYNGPSGLLKAHSFRPDAIICDIGLPGMNGFDVALAFRSKPEFRDVTLVALSGYAMPDDLRRSKEVGFDHHLRKPATLAEIENLLFGRKG